MKVRVRPLLPGFLALASIACSVLACSAPPEDSRIGVLAPDRAQFAPVGTFLDLRCGTLDCHGSRRRNLQIWGCGGMRVDPSDKPLCRAGGAGSTDAELDATYRSLVGLEPALMSQVVSGKGQHPELLTFVRKARGEEQHKGGTLVAPGGPQDVCLVSWLAGATDTDACKTAIAQSIPKDP